MTTELRDRILSSLIARYGSFTTISQALDEDSDTLVVNIQDDLDDDTTEDEILEVVRSGIDRYYSNRQK